MSLVCLVSVKCRYTSQIARPHAATLPHAAHSNRRASCVFRFERARYHHFYRYGLKVSFSPQKAQRQCYRNFASFASFVINYHINYIYKQPWWRPTTPRERRLHHRTPAFSSFFQIRIEVYLSPQRGDFLLFSDGSNILY